jgi:hypothetical protein
MDVWRQKSTVVSKLRVKGARLDTVAARLHFERLFGADNFLPAGLPPKAIVCIKNLRDPLPRTLRLTRFDLTRSDAWRNSVAREIEKLYRRAFRPIRETVPAQAESVVFADNSELLASLASDWCEGLLAGNWWWRSLFPNLHLTETIARIWLDAAEFAPFALQILAKKGKAAKFVAKLQPDEVSGLLSRIITVFGLGGLKQVLFESIEKKEEFVVSPAETIIEKKSEDFFFVQSQKRAPWSEFVPETQNSSLNFQKQSLLGIGLLLARAPRLARSSEFARQVKIFRVEFEAAQTAQSKNKITKTPEKAEKRQKRIQKLSSSDEKPKSKSTLRETKIEKGKSSAKHAIKFFADSADAREKIDKSSDSSNKPEAENFFPAEKVKEKAKKLVFDDSPTEKKSDRRESEKETKSYQPEKRITPQNILPEIAASAENEFFEDAENDFEFVVETRFGGVFYLLNLGLYLNLYRDFTESGEAEIDLNIWDFVALLSIEFTRGKIKDDAVWKLLEWLAGRENDEEAGHGFTAPDAWRIPPEWLKTFQTNQKWFWINTGKRLVVRHPSGFSIVDVPLLDNAQTQLENELEIYEKGFSGLVESNLKDFPESFSPPENWLKNLIEYVRVRLLQALNLETNEQIHAILFERHAKVTVTATHLDVTFSLADLPFEVRLSGLDRNPSWIPAVGKFVNFHFV